MNKQQLQQQVCACLEADLALAIRAAQAAHQAATDEESKAENKYDTRGLEASYLAAGQSRRIEEIRQTLAAWRNLQMREFDETLGIQLGALVWLQAADGRRQCLLLGPDGAGLKLPGDADEIMLITPRAPLGQQLLGLGVGDEVSAGKERWEILRAH
ncbi:transcription elongation factor GreAB [Pseudomonas sp. PDM14]|uniref:transcription elongation factor GreAB n=1 Tax=Pseudomonas sp. PDM14 TaxID=2769288 RepID=UPI001780A7DC|nr:transcription elongation factor GreAB [Pseudomonas sp. PDM14]MBD9482941.1 transcription elongation factor GreAB [Pseudomonas sp. PDM14]